METHKPTSTRLSTTTTTTMPQNGFQSQHEKIPLGNYEPSMARREEEGKQEEEREGVREEEEEEEKEEERRTFIKNHETSV